MTTLLAFGVAVSGCVTSGPSDSANLRGASPGVVASSPDRPTIEPWVFQGEIGQSIGTPNYRIHTTSRDAALVELLPQFYEAAHLEYERLVEDDEDHHSSPRSSSRASHPRKMDVYFFETRTEWEKFAFELLGDRAELYTRIGRGGFSTRGSSMMYNLGSQDSLIIAAHEGWHQFTQSQFEEPLPPWIDEGVAVWMEGFSVDQATGEVEFAPWRNPGRMNQLIDAMRNDRLMTLEELIRAEPGELLTDSNQEVLDYYAQVWALILFLNEYDGGRYARRLQQVLDDARHGRLDSRIRATFRKRGWSLDESMEDSRAAEAVWVTYFGSDYAAIDVEFRTFVSDVIASPDMASLVNEGISPYLALGGF